MDGCGGASGFFSPHSAFMLMRGQRTDLRIFRDVVRDSHGVADRLWLATTDASSWAVVDRDGRTADRFTAWEHRPRRLWGQAEAAYRWWCEAGCPGPERFGLTVAPDGTHVPWLDTPDNPVPVLP